MIQLTIYVLSVFQSINDFFLKNIIGVVILMIIGGIAGNYIYHKFFSGEKTKIKYKYVPVPLDLRPAYEKINLNREFFIQISLLFFGIAYIILSFLFRDFDLPDKNRNLYSIFFIGMTLIFSYLLRSYYAWIKRFSNILLESAMVGASVSTGFFPFLFLSFLLTVVQNMKGFLLVSIIYFAVSIPISLFFYFVVYKNILKSTSSNFIKLLKSFFGVVCIFNLIIGPVNIFTQYLVDNTESIEVGFVNIFSTILHFSSLFTLLSLSIFFCPISM